MGHEKVVLTFSIMPRSYYSFISCFFFFFISLFSSSGGFFATDTLSDADGRFNFDEIVVLLEEKNHETVLEINLDALTTNYNFYKQKLHQNTKIMVMVKAFAYGSGSYEVANLLQFHRADYLAVAYADEGVALRSAGISVPIMVMSPESNAFAKMIANKLEPEIYSTSILKSFINFLPEN